MLKRHSYVLIVSLCLSSCASLFAKKNMNTNNEHIKILVVDLERAENESDIGKKLQLLFDRWMADAKKQIELLERIAESLEKEPEHNNDCKLRNKINISDFDISKFKECTEKNRRIMLYSLAKKKSQKMQSLMKEVSTKFNKFIRGKIKDVAERHNSDMVIDSSVLVYGKNTEDITDIVIKEINSSKECFKIPEVLKNYEKQ